MIFLWSALVFLSTSRGKLHLRRLPYCEGTASLVVLANLFEVGSHSQTPSGTWGNMKEQTYFGGPPGNWAVQNGGWANPNP